MDLKSRIKLSLQQHKYFVFMFLFFVFVYIYSTFDERGAKPEEKLLTFDTLIPKGYALVPIELENISAIASLIESYGVVDIYLGANDSQKSKKILQKVKILRAPNNPNAYSLLLPDHLSSDVLKYKGPFFAVIQNKAQASDNPSVQETLKTKPALVKIEYNGG